MRLFARAALAAVIAFACLPALAADAPKPIPYEEAIPNKAGQCITVAEMKIQLGEAIRQAGGAGFLMPADRAQAFADTWRSALGTKAPKVSAVIGWIQQNVVVGEFDEKGCLSTFTAMTIHEFEGLVMHMPKQPEPMKLRIIIGGVVMRNV